MIYGTEEINSLNTQTNKVTKFKALCGRTKHNDIYIVKRY